MKFRLAILPAFILLFSSCIHSRYYRKVRRNIADFEVAVAHYKPVNFTSAGGCIYLETADSLSKELMEEYGLKKICVSGRRDHVGDTAITFHRDFNPMFGKADVVYYDFGKSNLRDHIKAGTRRKDEKLKLINSSFLYALYSKPAFGF